jgi:hypothetical protein
MWKQLLTALSVSSILGQSLHAQPVVKSLTAEFRRVASEAEAVAAHGAGSLATAERRTFGQPLVREIHFAAGVVENSAARSAARNTGAVAGMSPVTAPRISNAQAIAKKANTPQSQNLVAKEITLSRRLHGEAATHAEDAIRAGKPDVLTIDRAGASTNRQLAIGAERKVPGKELDEYPPAMFKEGGAGASVRPINPRDNRSAGACVGNACRGLPDGTRIRIKIGKGDS